MQWKSSTLDDFEGSWQPVWSAILATAELLVLCCCVFHCVHGEVQYCFHFCCRIGLCPFFCVSCLSACLLYFWKSCEQILTRCLGKAGAGCSWRFWWFYPTGNLDCYLYWSGSTELIADTRGQLFQVCCIHQMTASCFRFGIMCAYGGDPWYWWCFSTRWCWCWFQYSCNS